MVLNSKKNVLIISFHFSPSSEVGAKRFSFFCNLFDHKDEAFDIHILTVKEKYLKRKDSTLPSPKNVHRTAMFFPLLSNSNNIFLRAYKSLWIRYFCLIDPLSGWILPALLKGLFIVKNYNIKTIIVTGPPFSPFIIATLLSITRSTKLIIDYRDPWTTHPWDRTNYYRNSFFWSNETG